MQSYFEVTVHFTDKEWRLQHFLFNLLHFSRQHIAERIQQIIIQILEENKITEKLLGIIMNNAASIVAASQELKEKLGNAEYIHQCYAAHILNIAVQYGLQLASPIIKQVREFVVKIHQSTKLCDSLRTICRFENTIELKPDLDIET